MTPEPSVEAYLRTVEDADRRSDAESLCALMEDITQQPATMWGTSIIGFGQAHYRYASGREGDTPLVSFSIRKREIVIYLADDFDADEMPGLGDLGPHRLGKGCLYLKRATDVDQDALRDIINISSQRRRDADPTAPPR